MINVLLFAHLQEQVGKGSIVVEFDNRTVTELKEKLQEEYQLGELTNVMTAVNEEYATAETIIRSGDTVALIPPVSGG